MKPVNTEGDGHCPSPIMKRNGSPNAAVVMGASWGGLQAFATILAALPRSFPAPVLLVQHQHPGSENRLAWLLDRHCQLPVVSPQDREPIRPGHVYVAPPGLHMLVEPDETLVFSSGPAVHYSRPALDPLFFSAGVLYGARLTGVILTGANQDGAAGLAYIKQRGGLTLAQSPVSSEAPAMPEAAIKTGAVARILDLEDIGPLLAKHVTES